MYAKKIKIVVIKVVPIFPVTPYIIRNTTVLITGTYLCFFFMSVKICICSASIFLRYLSSWPAFASVKPSSATWENTNPSALMKSKLHALATAKASSLPQAKTYKKIHETVKLYKWINNWFDYNRSGMWINSTIHDVANDAKRESDDSIIFPRKSFPRTPFLRMNHCPKSHSSECTISQNAPFTRKLYRG